MTNVFGMLISAALIPLSIRILLQMYNNITTLEMMHDKMFRYPCIGAAETDRDGNKLAPNEYDMLWLPNMKQVLGPSLWMWPFPFAPDIKGEGLFFPRLPDVSSTDLKSNEQAYKKEDFEMDTDDYVKKALKKYGGRTFVLVTPEEPNGKRIMIGEEHEI
jgi:hypothetical protein